MRSSISGMPRLDSDIEQKASLFVFVALFYKSQELNILGGCRGMVSDEILEFHALFYPNSQVEIIVHVFVSGGLAQKSCQIYRVEWPTVFSSIEMELHHPCRPDGCPFWMSWKVSRLHKNA
ncbi:hypothetical protein D5086_006017 [Populus alba]|uniref:Uncharacterized protein n=1 Tax=Populus alba TaxID=43335 RepID=A0ACC4CJG1_POPAL